MQDQPGPRQGDGASLGRLPGDLGDLPAAQVISGLAVHLMSAAAARLGLSEESARHRDLGEARALITALAGLVTAGAPVIDPQYATPLRDGLAALQLAYREACGHPQPPGAGPGEGLTGPVYR
ncbi:MAG: DUF1844 domain-containing protein [Carbonactinosporaceae bacterium]